MKLHLFNGIFIAVCLASCSTSIDSMPALVQKQITLSEKNHALDNNDNFSPDGKFLCYDTRGTIFNNDLANSKSIEKVEIATGKETVIWEPKSITGEQAAPGVAAVSYHPTQNKVVFIHGPFLEEVDFRGYYGQRNRTGVEVSADGNGKLSKLDLRDITNNPTTPGAHRGGTHRHEYSRDGKRIGFTYDDSLVPDYGRTIGYMETHNNAPDGYSHYFSLLVKPAIKATALPGEIVKAHSDSWVDSAATKRAFIGVVRANNGVDFENSLFIAEINEAVDITTANAGTKTAYPTPAQGINIRRLTHSHHADGIVRGSFDGKSIAYLDQDSVGVKQVFIIPTNGSDTSQNLALRPKQLTQFKHDASSARWHPSDNYIFTITNGNVTLIDIVSGRISFLTNDNQIRSNLVISSDGKTIAYNKLVKGIKGDKSFMQIFTLPIELNQ